MSEPPLKKKRTILDFFRGKHSKKDKTDNKMSDKDGAENSGKKAFSSSLKEKRSEASKELESSSKPKLSLSTRGRFMADSVPSTSEAGASGPAPPEPASPTLPLDDDSPDLFDSEPQPDSQGGMIDSQDSSTTIPTRKPSKLKDGSSAWRGIPLKTLNRTPDCMEDLGQIQPSVTHTVLFKQSFKYDGKRPPTPFPITFKDRWDADHVRLPCSHQNEYPVADKGGKPVVKRRWNLIEEALLVDIPGPFELEEAILKYNSRYAQKWNFTVMHHFFTDFIEEEERRSFFGPSGILKGMIRLALQLPNICTQPIPLLKKSKTQSVTFSQQQCACLLANAFFCTYPRRNAKQKHSEYTNYPTINFNSLFSGPPTSTKMEKMRCIIHYFRRVLKKMPLGTVTFTRQCVIHMPFWDNEDTKLKALHVSSEGTIEDDGLGMLQVDFANKYLGGGVLGHGCVQEEIRFLICPEMFISRLITEGLDRNECLIMTGCERFSNYDGYANKFEWKENYEDLTLRDSWGRLCCEVVAIDALVIHDHKSQFTRGLVKRELDKAYSGFVSLERKRDRNVSAICTGNWGCGAFGGDKRLKALIQLMAAAQARRDTCYFTFDDEKLRDDIFNIHKYLTSDNVLGIGDLLNLIEQYRRNYVQKSHHKPKINLFEYIIGVFDGRFEDTDEDSGHSLEMQYHNDFPEEDEVMASDWDQPEKMDDKNAEMTHQDSENYKANTP